MTQFKIFFFFNLTTRAVGFFKQ